MTAHDVPGRPGFTLIEVIVVLVILALTAAVSAPAFRAVGARDAVHQAADAVTALLDRARTQALAQAHDVTLDIDPATARVWRTAPDTALQLALPPTCALHAASDRVRFVYRADGSAAGDVLTVECAAGEFAVSVDPLTGNVQLMGAQ